MCDWVNDEQPYCFANGIVNLPLSHELSDRQIVTVQQQSADSWAQQMRCVRLAGGRSGGASRQGSCRALLPIHVTP